ncbi:putative Calcium/calmodulin-dependent protein kinase [Planktothrix serta PCC 8927]|uniref:non-specific serine/threonine protein kinase n=1 Tax=Planktothrix serta PCC 8927 TaxID=671068 RepID=A0A7Z9BMM0_9CYAN|nr:serine/threonine-protein kinase [Planktothrix serta]VXD15133.1 putative Calcium/calmodulin-dependent protein kinase [Planktothrix serta PCC 8927]
MDTQLANRYRLIKPLGSGGFGQTFLAQDLHLPHDPLCVVKQLKPTSTNANTQQIAKRLFIQEAEVLHRLGHHEQIPSLLAHFEQNQEFYLVQDYIEGQPLNELIVSGRAWSEGEVIIFLQEILHVLAFVHENQVIHRDIKPANLIRRHQDNKIVLIDFGAVKEVSLYSVNSTGETTLTVAVGTPNYMPSEQQAFKPKFSSDIFAVGIIAMQALSGLSPRQFPQDLQGEYCCRVLPMSKPISEAFATILDKMVRYDYRQRYPTAQEALVAILELTDVFEQSTVALDPLSQSIAHPPNILAPPIPGISSVKTVASDSIISSIFQEQCRQALAEFIGPFANFIVEDILTQFPQLTPEELVDKLAANIPNSNEAQAFRKRLRH